MRLKPFFLFLFFLGFFFSSIWGFRHPLFALIFEKTLFYYSAEKVSYLSREWDAGCLCYKDLQLGDKFKTRSLKVGFEGRFFAPPRVNLEVDSPELTVSEGSTSSFSINLIAPLASPLIDWVVQVNRGNFKFKDEVFPFSISSLPDSLQVQVDKAVSCAVKRAKEGFDLYVQFTEFDMARLAQLLSFVDPKVEGKGALSGEIKFFLSRSFALEYIEGELDILNGCIAALDAGWMGACDKMQARFCAEPFQQERISLDASFEGGLCKWQEHSLMESCKGSVSFKRESEFKIYMEGLSGKEKTVSNLQGEGGFQGLEEFWIQADLTSKEKGNLLLSFCRDKKNHATLQADFHQFSLPFLQDLVPLELFTITKGIAEGKVQASFQESCLREIYLEDLRLQEIQVSQGKDKFFCCDSLRLSAELEKVEEWKAHYVEAFCKKLCFQMQEQRGEDVELDLCVRKNSFEKGVLKGSFQNFSGEVEFTGPIDAAHLKYHLLADLALKEPLHLKGKGVKSGKEWALEGEAYFSEEKLFFGLSLDAFFSPKQGWAKMEKLTERGLIPLLQLYGIDENLSLAAALDFSLEEGEIYGELSLDHLDFKADNFKIHVPSLKEKGQFSYQLKNKDGWLMLPLKGVELEEKLHGISLFHVDGELQIAQGDCLFKQLRAHLKETTVCAEAVIKDVFSSERSLHLETEEIEGKLEDLAPFFSASYLKNLKGSFKSGRGGLKLRLSSLKEPTEIDWSVKAFVKEVNFPLAYQELIFSQVSGDIAYDSSTEIFVLSEVSGLLTKQNKRSYPFSLNSFYYEKRDKEIYRFDATLLEDRAMASPILKVEAEGSAKDALFCHLKGSYFTTHFGADLHFSDALSSVQGEATFISSSFREELRFLADLGWISLNEKVLEKINSLEGSFEGKVGIQSPEAFLFELKGKSSDTFFELKGRKEKKEWIIDQLLSDEFKLKGRLSQKEDREGYPVWDAVGDLRWKGILCSGQIRYEKGRCFLKLGKISGLFPEGFSCRGEGVSEITFKPSFEIRSLVLNLEDQGKITFPCLKYQNTKWEADNVALFFPSPYLEQPVKALFTVRFSEKEATVQGVFSEGSIALGQESCLFKSFQGLYTPEGLLLKGLIAYHDTPFLIQARLNSFKDRAAQMVVQEPSCSEVLRLSFLGDQIKEVKGFLSGLQIDLKQKAPFHYQGSIKVQEGKRAALLFPKDLEFVKEIDHIELKGVWGFQPKNFSFVGDLSGHKAQVQGYFIEAIESKIQARSDLFLAKEIQITDRAGKIAIKQLQALKKEGWIFYAPLVRGQNIQPSLLRHKDFPDKKEKPFIIRNLSVTDFAFSLKDKSLMQGDLIFNFTNGMRKESSILDTSLSLLKDLGLDFTLLTPVAGEVVGQFQKGRLVLKELKNTFSEARRSEFYLARDYPPSFIDLEGNLKVNLRVKQDVLLKLMEPFVLTIRGKIDSPRYAIE